MNEPRFVHVRVHRQTSLRLHMLCNLLHTNSCTHVEKNQAHDP